MQARLNLILLGVDDIARSSAFYAALGWQAAPTSHAGFIKIDLGGVVLGLISRSDLAADAGQPASQPAQAAHSALVYLARQPGEVAETLAQVEQHGGTLVKPATQTAWGVAGYFRDPDGHLFEVCYEDAWVFDESGRLLV
ncbi:VOC family protein [Jeongeupia naejangsanensis]|uniref:VOC family protein n=1 Tax=Jeongeupia naejangsanensis TaxID=613195 RepID=A0ABS2BHH7_9NEIS|nr:VOC family protein [Jeongeupia naejangsanensis]MBM3115072.1 VOC family protein [Jeongeupia naejangsanensis]